MELPHPIHRQSAVCFGLLLGLIALTPGVVRAFEAIDGRLQVHGYYEMQLRGISADWDQQFDMTQWYNVLNIEFELDLAPEGFDPFFDIVQAYVRTEVRFDCIYYDGCGMVSSMHTYGNHSSGLPERLSGGRQRLATEGLAQNSTSANVFKAPQDQQGRQSGRQPGASLYGKTVARIEKTVTNSEIIPSHNPEPLRSIPPFKSFANFAGLDGYRGRPPRLEQFNNLSRDTSYLPADLGDRVLRLDDPYHFVFNELSHIRGTIINGKGGAGFGLPVSGLLPWRPKDYTGPNALLANKPNPFDDSRSSPTLAAAAYNSTMYAFLDGYSQAIGEGRYRPGDMQVFLRDPVTEQFLLGPDGKKIPGTQTWYNNRLTDLLPVNLAGGAPLSLIQQAVRLKSWEDLANTTALAARGSGANPLAPIPCVAGGTKCVPNGSRVNATGAYAAQGLFLPTRALRDSLREGTLKDKEFREVFRQTQIERAFNHGWSQSRTYELKEAYLDLEMFDSKLWLRIGKQNIVWGKTEVFRTTDQFNPLDLSLASLPSLEEARIPLLALRGVYSLYDVGPLQDVRFEVAVALDKFQGSDFGTCGEPYAPDLVCLLGLGALGHGTAGFGVAGIELPDPFWEDIEGLEGGMRIEFRYDRFSFAISDYYGYSALPYIKTLTSYDRNVDPVSGRMRIQGGKGRCRTLPSRNAFTRQKNCLTPGPIDFTNAPSPLNYNNQQRLRDPRNALESHPANQQVYAVACASTIGISSSLSPEACGTTAVSSTGGINVISSNWFSAAQFFGSLLTGSPIAAGFLATSLELPDTPGGDPFVIPVVPLNIDQYDQTDPSFFPYGKPCLAPAEYYSLPPTPNPPELVSCGGGGGGLFARVPGFDPGFGLGPWALGQFLTPEQEALLGCGPFFGTQCDNQGINLLNADASTLFQSFVMFDGTYESVPCQQKTSACWRTDDASRPQPGTLKFLTGERAGTRWNRRKRPDEILGGPVATRYDPARKRAIVLPGARRTTNPAYNYQQDGCANPNLQGCAASNFGAGANTLTHPFTGQQFGSELAALSWNLMTVLTILDPLFDKTNDGVTPPGRQAGVCSFVTPQICNGSVSVFPNLAGLTRNIERAGGNGKYGRRTFSWQGGGEVVLAYEKRNVLGFSMDFAEDVTKSNWAFEFAWIGKQPVTNADSLSNNTDVQDLNLSVGIDRPTFIRFLNPNRTFFFNTQLFFQYREGYQDSMPSTGPFNFLFTLAVQTAYWQDRLLPLQLFVYDVQSQSGSSISQITYRINSNFSINFGISFFFGAVSYKPMPINGLGLSNRSGPHAYEDGVYNGLGILRDRDEVFMRLRYTF